MALTNAERQKKYRERMRIQNPAKYEEIKTKNAERNKRRKKIKECSNEIMQLKRKQWRDSQNRHRTKAKDTTSNHENYVTTDNGAEINAKRASERKRFQRRLNVQKKSYDETVKKMALEIQSLKKKCKRYMQKNKQLIEVIEELKLKTSEGQVVIPVDNEMTPYESSVIIHDENKMTPLSKSNSFIEQNLPCISEEEKQKVRRQLLTHNVLVNAIQDTYTKTTKNDERNVLKRILKNDSIQKYSKKSEITKSVFGLKGQARQSRNIIRKNNVIVNEIIKFYNQDDVSRATAGKKEFKSKGKIKKQKRYLLGTLKALYKKYRMNGGRAKKSSFQKYKPFYVVSPKLSDRETCGCIKHENFFMKVKKLHSLGMIKKTEINEILLEVVCDLDSKECAYGECSTCSNESLKFNGDTCYMNEIVTWNEFAMQTHEYINKNDGQKVSTKKMAKKEVQGTLKSLTEFFNNELKIMRKHAFNIKHQYSQYLSCIKNLKSTEVAIHIDFSENYVCKLSTEVQSMHFGASKSQVTIHTGVLYVKEKKPQSFASISPSTEHGPEAIWAHLKPILNYVRENYPLVNAVHFFSDGPATQYKQKKNFFLFTKYMKDLGFPHSTWNFSESAHGKGAADGVGGGLKRRLDDYVKHGIDIPDAYTAYTLLKNSDTSVMTFYIEEDDIAKYCIEEDLTPVPQTMNLHQIANTETTNVIRFRCLSCFCGDSYRGYCECFDVKNHQLVVINNKNDKNKTNKSNLKSGDDEANQVEKGKKKTKVTILSEIRYTAENMAYDNLQNFGPINLQKMQKIDKKLDLFSRNLNHEKENINYDNPVPSTSGTGNTQSNRTTAIKKRPVMVSVTNPDDSCTDDDDQYSLHDESELEDFYEEPLSDTEEEVEEKTYSSTQNNNNEDAENIKTATDNDEKKQCTTSAGEEENIKESTKETKEKLYYNIDDSVIVRYYLRNKWKYYVGFVETINHEENGIFYAIRFLKTIHKPRLKFVATKKDRDFVPEISIVKKVELEFDSKEYFIKDDNSSDQTYFC